MRFLAVLGTSCMPRVLVQIKKNQFKIKQKIEMNNK